MDIVNDSLRNGFQSCNDGLLEWRKIITDKLEQNPDDVMVSQLNVALGRIDSLIPLMDEMRHSAASFEAALYETGIL